MLLGKMGLAGGLIVLSALMGSAQTPAPTPAAQTSDAAWSADPFRIVKRTADIPAAVKKQFPNAVMQKAFRMAEPGKPFQATDFVLDAKLPTRRLIFAGVSKEYCFVHYEHGGRGYSCGVAVFRLSGKTARFVGGLILWKPAPDLAALRKAVVGKPLVKDTGGF